MEGCVGNFGHEFVGRTEHNNSITTYLALERITLMSEAPVTRD